MGGYGSTYNPQHSFWLVRGSQCVRCREALLDAHALTSPASTHAAQLEHMHAEVTPLFMSTVLSAAAHAWKVGAQALTHALPKAGAAWGV